MNNFTIEELQEIKDGLSWWLDVKEWEKKHDIFRKIQSLIHNYYCQHESDGLIYTSNPPQNKCIKCREFYR